MRRSISTHPDRDASTHPALSAASQTLASLRDAGERLPNPWVSLVPRSTHG
jgi:hypothetical protein